MAREQVLTIIARIPKGRVTTYGRIARMTEGASARSVGAILRTLPEGHTLPWQRIVCAGGKLADHGGAGHQRRLLEEEGVTFDGRGRIKPEYLWP